MTFIKQRIFNGIFILLTFLNLGCTPAKVPDSVAFPNPPDWLGVNEAAAGKCVDFSSRFSLIPAKAVLYGNSTTWVKEAGQEWDYVNLFPNRSEPANELKLVQLNLGDELEIGLKNKHTLLYFISPRPSEEHLANEKHYYSGLGDFTCINGEIIFPDQTYNGGSEGGSVFGRIHTKFNLTGHGDLLFYQQTTGKKIMHRYILFKKVKE